MKNTNQAKLNQHNAQFNQRLHHLQGFIGLANWQLTPPSPPTAADIRAYERKGRQQLAADNKHLLRTGIKQLANRLRILIVNTSNRIKMQRRNQQNLQALRGLTDHLLTDIGVSRTDLTALQQQQTTLADIKANRAKQANHIEPDEKPSLILQTQLQSVHQLAQSRPCANDHDEIPAAMPSKAIEQQCHTR